MKRCFESRALTSTTRATATRPTPPRKRAIAELEGAERALLFSSGMTAITTTVLALLKSGDHIVSQRDIYGGTAKFFTRWLPKLGIETTFVDVGDYEQQARAIRPEYETDLRRITD